MVFHMVVAGKLVPAAGRQLVGVKGMRMVATGWAVVANMAAAKVVAGDIAVGKVDRTGWEVAADSDQDMTDTKASRRIDSYRNMLSVEEACSVELQNTNLWMHC